MAERAATVKRETQETTISVRFDIDGDGNFEITTGIRMFDHLLTQIARHGVFDIKISATSDNPHHLVEDAALCLGQAFNKALGDKKGIVRMSHAIVPMDDALSLVSVDIGGRGYAVTETTFDDQSIADLPSSLVHHFLETFASEARINLHTKIIRGSDDHHKAESLFKALAQALDLATRIDDRKKDIVPSTKGIIDN